MEWFDGLWHSPTVERARNFGFCVDLRDIEKQYSQDRACNSEDDSRNDESKHDILPSKNISRGVESRDTSQDSSIRWTSFWNKFGNEVLSQELSHDQSVDSLGDDASVVSTSSGVSTLSIDYNFVENNPALKGDKVDLSNLGDEDDNSVFTSNTILGCDKETVIVKNREKSSAPRSTRVVDNTNEIEIATSFMSIERKQSALKNSQHPDRPTIIKTLEANSLADNPQMETKRKTFLHELRTKISTNGRYKVPVAKIVTQLADLHFDANQFEICLTLYQEALSIYSAKLGDHDSASTDIQVRLGKVREKMGQDVDALELFFRALKLVTSVEGTYNVNASTIRTHIAQILQRQEKNKEAIKELKKALRGYREKYGDEHITVADTVDMIGDNYNDQGTHDKACSVRAELVKLRVALHGTRSIAVAETLEKWADSHDAVGDKNGALKVMKQAYVMYHDVVGANSHETERSLRKIGDFYSALGQNKKALKAYTSVVVMQKERFGEQSPEIADSYITLGKAFIEVNQFEKALKSFNRSMAIHGAANGSNNAYIGPMMLALHEIGVVYQKTGKHEQALKAFYKEHSIRKKIIANDVILIAKTLIAVGDTYKTMQKYEPSFNSYLEALQIYDKKDGRSLIFCETLFKCAESQYEMGELSKACLSFKEVLRMYRVNGINEDNLNVKKSIDKLKEVNGLTVGEIRSLDPSPFCSLLDAGRVQSD